MHMTSGSNQSSPDRVGASSSDRRGTAAALGTSTATAAHKRKPSDGATPRFVATRPSSGPTEISADIIALPRSESCRATGADRLEGVGTMDLSSPRDCLHLASPVLDLGERTSTRCRRRPHRLRGGTWTLRTPTWRRWLFSFLRRREDAAPAAVPLRAGQPLPCSFPIPVPAGVAFTVLCCRHLLAPPRVLPQPDRFWVRCPVQVPNLCQLASQIQLITQQQCLQQPKGEPERYQYRPRRSCHSSQPRLQVWCRCLIAPC